MAIALLPSEIARLILGYLLEEGLKDTAQKFLDECKYLEECRAHYKRGLNIPKTIHGKSLLDYLFYDPKGTIKVNSDIKETQTDIIDWNNYLSQISSLNNKKSKKNGQQQQEIASLMETNDVICLGNKRPAQTQQNFDNSDVNLVDESNKKKPRILIGRNVEKVPELSCSTLERQLGIIITDASNFLKEQEEKEKQNLENNTNNNSNVNNDINNSNIVSTNKFAESYFATPTRLSDFTIQSVNQSQSILVDCAKFNSPSKLISQQITSQIPILNGIPILYNNTNTQILTSAATAIPIRPLNQVIESHDIVNGKIKIDRIIRPQSNPQQSNPQPTTAKKIKEITDEDSKRKNEMFKDLTRIKRGPKKSDIPKKKRTVFNRVTPTIKQMMDNSLMKEASENMVVSDSLLKVPEIAQTNDFSNNNNMTKNAGDAHAELLDLLGLTENTNVEDKRLEKENLIKETVNSCKTINGQEQSCNELDEWFDAIAIKSREEEEVCEIVNLPNTTLNTTPTTVQSKDVVERRLRNRTISQRKL